METSSKNYKRFARIYFQVLDCTQDAVIVKVWQLDNPANKYLSAKELTERTKGVFDDSILPKGVSLHVRPIPFEREELRDFSISDIERKMQQYQILPKDLVAMLDIDKSSISLLLNERRGLTKPRKAMFYYFFKNFETRGVYQ